MLALLRGTPEVAAEVAADAGGLGRQRQRARARSCSPARARACARAAEIGRERGVRTLALDVTGAFHSPWMAAAQEPFREALERVELARARR